MTYPPPEQGTYGQPGTPPPPGYGYGPYGQPVQPPPGYGYLVPAPPPQFGANDPLVTGATEGFGGWFSRLFAVLGRSWKSILLISWSTAGVPVAVLAVVAGLTTNRMVVMPAPGSSQAPRFDSGAVGTFIVILLVAAIVGAYLTAVAQAATVWAVTREAAGGRAPLGAALGYGFRNGLRLFGWSLLYGVIVGVGLVACIIPGIYLGVAGCLYIPIALYRRGMSPIGTSFSMVNRSFWAALGRMLLLLVMVYGVQLVLSIPAQIVSAGSRAAGLVLTVVVELVTAPLALVLTIGTVLLFAELWNKGVPTTTADLNAAL
jgi:hypothetical protein